MPAQGGVSKGNWSPSALASVRNLARSSKERQVPWDPPSKMGFLSVMTTHSGLLLTSVINSVMTTPGILLFNSVMTTSIVLLFCSDMTTPSFVLFNSVMTTPIITLFKSVLNSVVLDQAVPRSSKESSREALSSNIVLSFACFLY